VSTTKQNHVQLKNGDQALLDGLKAQEPTLAPFTIAESVVKTADVVAMLEKRIAAADAVPPAKAAWHDAVKAAQAARTSTETTVSGVRQALLGIFGTSTQKLAAFGLKPRKARTPPTAEKKAAAAAKAKATRAARHTMGSKQKQAVKGDVTGVTITPTTAPKPVAPVATSSPTVGATSSSPTAGSALHAGT